MTTENFNTLSPMIAPAVFMAAAGSLILSTAQRMGRIVEVEAIDHASGSAS